jgi:hypothetical protein
MLCCMNVHNLEGSLLTLHSQQIFSYLDGFLPAFNPLCSRSYLLPLCRSPFCLCLFECGFKSFHLPELLFALLVSFIDLEMRILNFLMHTV